MKKFKINYKIFILVILSALTLINIISFASKFSTKEIKGESVLYKMFIETEPGSGEYQPSSDYVFPTSGYSLDTERTTCSNDGTVSQTSDFKINYIGSTSNCTFYFKRINTSNTISVIARSLTYNGLDQELVTISNSQGTVYYSTTNALDSTNYTSGSTNIPTAKDTGNYTVYYYTPGNTSYNGASGSVSSSIANYTPQISLEEKSSGHTGSAVPANTAVVTLVNGETFNGTITYTYYNGETCQGTPLSGPPSAVGNYSVKASTEAFTNYNASTSGCVKHTIVKNSTAAEGSCGNLTYSGNQQTLAQGGQHVIYINNYGTAAGEYTVTVTAEQNYTFNDGTEQKTLTCSIAPKQLTPSVTSQNKEYDGSTDAVCNVSLTGIVGSDAVTASAGSHTFANADVGNEKTVTCSNITLAGANASNYTLNATTKTATANITAKSIYVTWGSNTTFTYDGNAHGPTVTTPISGVYGETINLTRTTQTNVGNYTSTASCSSVTGGRAKCTNYTLTNQIKAFTITGKAVQYTSSNYSGVYDGASHTFTLNATEPTSGNTIYYSTSAAFTTSTCDSSHGSTTKPTAKNVSDSKTVYWCIKPSNTNYKTVVGSNSITISRKELTSTQITNYSANWVNGSTTYSRNVSTGVGSETVSLTYTPYENTAGTYTFATAAASGKYTLSQSNNNYSIGSAGSFTINAVSCAAPTNLAVSNTGEVTWTASSNCSNAQYQISIDGTNYTAATSGIDYNSTITSATGSRTVYVKTVAPSANYSDSTNATATVTVYSVTLSKGTGISAVSGAGNYISGRTVTISATVSAGYTWSKWTQSSGGAQVSTNRSYSAAISSNWAYTANTTANSLTFNNQTLSEGTYGTVYTSSAFTAASNGSGNYTYTISSGAPTGATIDSANRKISFTNSTSAGTYSVVVLATDNTTGSTKTATMTIKINPQQCAAPTNLAVSNAGVVTWTASATTACTSYKIGMSSSPNTNATNGMDYNSTITSSTGNRTVYVKTVAPNSNYSDSTNATETVTVYSVTLTKGTGISAVSGSGNYISGRSVSISATVSTGYTWSKWTQTSGGAQVSTNRSYSAAITSNWAYTANATANELTFNNQTLSAGTYGTAYTSGAFTAASNGSGNYTYTISSGAPNGATIDSANRKISFTNSTSAGTYNVVVLATDNTTGATKTATMTIVINPQQCNAPTNVAVSNLGVVTWTASSNCSNSQHQVSMDGTNFTNASSGVDYNTSITSFAGNRTVYVKAKAPNSNYSDSTSATKTVTVYSVIVSRGTGISAVTGSGNYISGRTVTITATAATGYTWSKWTQTYGGAQVSTNRSYSAAISSNWTYTANATVNALTFNNQTLSAGTYGTAYTSGSFTAASNGSGNYTYTISSGAPTGATIDSANRKISFTNSTDAGTYSVVVLATDNTTGATKTATMTIVINPKQCAAPTNLQVSNTGIVTWTNSTTTACTEYKIALISTPNQTATNGMDYNNSITAATGSRTVYVKAVSSNSNYSDSSNASKSVTVYSVTLTKGTGISAVSGSGNYISGRSVTIDATVSNGYTWSKWTQTSGGAQVSTTKSYSVTVNDNLAYTANAVDSTAPTVTITRSDYNTFTWSASDNKGVTGYAITNSSTAPTSWTTTGTLTSGTYDVSSANTWYVWAKDQAGNTSSANIKSYTISRSQGTGTTLTTRYDSTSSSSGTAFTNSTVMLAGTSVWAKSVATTGYHNPTLKHGNTTMTASGSSFNVSATETINSTASSNQVAIEVYLNDEWWEESEMQVALYNGTTPTEYEYYYYHDIWFDDVANGTYNVYASKSVKEKTTLVDTGIDVIVNNNSTSIAIDYYTVTVLSGGSGIGIDRVRGSGTYLAGQAVEISADIDPYYHTWDGWSGSGDHLYNESYDNYGATAYCTVTQESSYLPRTYYTSSVSITREDYNTFSYDVSGWQAYAYYVSTSSTKPNKGQASSSFALNTWTTATTTGNLNLTAGTTYYVWAEDDPSGSVSDNYATITTYSYTGTAGTGSSLSVKYENSSGTTAPISGVVLGGTPLYLQATANIGYINPVLKKGTTTLTNPTTTTIYSNTTFSSSATAEAHVYEISSGTYGYAPDLATAISRANAGATITALSNNSTSGQTISKNLTINTNGKTITVSSGQIIVSSGKILTVNGTGKIYSTVDTDTISVNGTLNWYNATLQNTARTAIANGGTTNIYSGTIRGYTHGIYSNGTTNISGTSNIYSDSSTSGYGVKVVSGKNVTISGSPTIKGYYGIYNQGTTTVPAGATPNIYSEYNNAIYNDTTGTMTLKSSSNDSIATNAYIEATNTSNGSNAIVNYGTIQIGSLNNSLDSRSAIFGNLYNIASASGYALYNGGTGKLYDLANYYVKSGHKTVYNNSSLTLYAGLFAYNNSGINSAFEGTKTNVGTWLGMSYDSYTMHNRNTTLQTNYASYRDS